MDLPQSVTPSASQVAAPAVARARARSGVAASLAQKATTQKRVQKKQARWPAGKFNRVRFPSFPGLPAVRYFPFSGPIFRTAAHRSREDDVDEIEEISGALSATRGELDNEEG